MGVDWILKLFKKTPPPPLEPPKPVVMSDAGCRYCLARLPQEDAASGVCDRCWYESKLEPMDWLNRLKAIGRPARLVDGKLLPYE